MDGERAGGGGKLRRMVERPWACCTCLRPWLVFCLATMLGWPRSCPYCGSPVVRGGEPRAVYVRPTGRTP